MSDACGGALRGCRVLSATMLFFGLTLALLAGCSDSNGRDSSGDGRGDAGGEPAMCEPACSGGTTCCAAGGVGRCVNLDSDPNHCDGCGNVCPSGMCRDGECVGDASPNDTGSTGDCQPACSASQRCCGTACVSREGPQGDLEARSDSSFANCGGCGIECDPERASKCGAPLGGGPVQCLCGNFESCAPGSVCVESGGSFQCADLQTDPNNCGALGEACNGEEICVAGECQCGTGSACGAGTTCCGGQCINTDDDPSNCGGCGVTCGGSNPDCSSGTCNCNGTVCQEPSESGLGELCCSQTCVPQSDDNCGSCGTSCDTSDDQACIVSMGGFGGLPGGGGGGGDSEPQVCCGEEIPLLGGVCEGGGFGFGDGGGFSFDGGLPFP